MIGRSTSGGYCDHCGRGTRQRDVVADNLAELKARRAKYVRAGRDVTAIDAAIAGWELKVEPLDGVENRS